MRKNPIGETILDLLIDRKVKEAITEFNLECDIRLHCDYKEKLKKCTKLCLLPKLNFMILNGRDRDVKDMVAIINKETGK